MMHTEDGARQFAAFFARTLDWADATGSASYSAHYFDADCTECSTLTQGIDKDHNAGKLYIGGRVALNGVQLPAASPDVNSDVDCVVKVSITAGETRAPDGRVIDATPNLPDVSVRLLLRWNGSSWLVAELTIATS